MNGLILTGKPLADLALCLAAARQQAALAGAANLGHHTEDAVGVIHERLDSLVGHLAAAQADDTQDATDADELAQAEQDRRMGYGPDAQDHHEGWGSAA